MMNEVYAHPPALASLKGQLQSSRDVVAVQSRPCRFITIPTYEALQVDQADVNCHCPIGRERAKRRMHFAVCCCCCVVRCNSTSDPLL